jgi:hypothetical protein
MGIFVKLRCSECETVRETELNVEDKEIVCPVCARRMANLPQEDHADIEAGMKSQRMFSIIAVVLFAIAIICVYMWMGPTEAWSYNKTGGATQPPVEANSGMFIGACVCAVAALVLGIIGSMKRYVVEF